MAEDTSTLSVFYQGWHDYQNMLTKVIAPLPSELLTLRATPSQRSIGQILLHMIGARARWFHDLMEIGDKEFASFCTWDRQGEPARDATELVYGLETTWRVMQETLTAWTPEDMLYSYKGEPGDPETFTRQWVIWHLIEHDLHHGGEVSLILGIHGLQAPAL
ncbi:MAG TPA: DinB family protein [Ktedonosporobacter sp.]|nr:DinB family protein [Ktedonosporobacter sp.]